MFTAKSSSPTNSNYDFTLRHERVKLLGRVLKQFDARISRTAQAMREVASCLSLAGQSYHEVVQCVNNTNPQTSANQTCFISFSNGLAENHGVSLRSAATLFAAEMKSIKDGEQYLSYDIGVHQTVLARLQEVLTKVHETRCFGDEVEATFKKLMSARNVVHKKEAKYMRKGRPLTDSKRYVKQCDKMHKKEQIFQAKLNVFDMEYDSLMQRQLYVAGHTMDDFLDVNTVYLSHMLKVLGCLAPHGAETIERMVNSGEKLSECLGVAPADQFGSRLRMRGVGLLESDNVTPIKVTDCTTTPGRGVPAKSSRTCRSHNFTTYYENRRQTTASADRAPPTTRALDGEGDENSTPGCPVNQTPQRQPVLNPTPLRAPFGVTEGNRQAESDAYLAGDSNPSPPPKAPSFPASARHTNLLAIGTTAACEAPGTAAGVGKQTSSMKRERPTAASVVTNADDSRRACDAATTGITRKVAHGHAPFGGSATPAFPSPAAAGGAKSSTKRPKGRPTLEFDPARPAEPFFDDAIASLCESTPRKSLQPIALFPLDFDEDCIPQKVTSRISTSTTVGGSTVTLQRPRRSSKNFKIASAASGSRGGALQPCIASAPPDEDTLTSSTNTNLQGSEKSIRSPRATHGHRPQPHVFRDPTGRPQRNTTLANLQGFRAMTVVGETRKASHQWSSDGLGSEVGGVTGRSQNLSTSYGLDSPVPTPQPCALNAQAWEDSQAMLRRYPTARSSRYTPLVGCAFLVETLYGSKYSANLGLYSMPYVYVKTILLCATGHGLKLREGRYLHGLVELLLPSKGSQDNLTKLELLQFIDGISSDSSTGCNDEAFRADEGEADEQATLAHLSSVHDDSGRVATAVSTIREDYGVSSSSSLYNEHETAPSSGQDYNHKHYRYLKGVGTEDGGVDYAGARFGSDAAAEGARLRAEGADEDAVAVESIMSFVSATAFPPTIARVLIYDAVCTCVADGRYSAKEKERVALVSSHIGLSSAVRSQIEKLALQEKVISIRKRRLLRLHSTHSNTTPLGEVRHCPALSAAHGVTNSSMHHARKQGGASVTRRGEISDSCDCRVAEENRDIATDDEAMRVEAAKKLLRRARAHRLPQRYVGA